MAEKEIGLGDVFRELDIEIRELLSLVHEIKIDTITGSQNKEKMEKALFLSEKITAEIYSLWDEGNERRYSH